ncbi:PD-(D/E)XK nuclease superfamily protein [Pseudobutyrivibrio sp. OR37]|uniref:AAA family ATPase n=1 Tax=Pseudobutyrivibrio sp. OR37 TaxID=1798186 RepID=UPI0008E940B4|nr:AAA family ATPase [Pseudobutyrivibrio sp. OR37]SFH98710.1 PD-(D/E)XK nuclease superfamily protein [Pseudobutyrivibrio sp. OR37]
MGIYLNPGNEEFKRIIKSNYIDKTGLISIINSKIETKKNLVCVSRPRRFGKSYAAQMLCSYYDCTCDSKELFATYQIARDGTWLSYLNQFNVIYLDITSFISDLNSKGDSINTVVNDIQDAVINDISAVAEVDLQASFTNILLKYVEYSGKKIVFIIDEWDAIIREAKDNNEVQSAYLNLLRSLFKNGNFTSRAVAAAYMTGILPIKKDGTESAVSDFDEFTIINPGKFSVYTGFNEDDIKTICEKMETHISADELKEWYDGYSFDGINPIYNPYSVMQAIEMGKLESYWRKTTAAETLFTYINMDFKGLQEDIARLISGEHIHVDINNFNNDVETFNSKDDVLTLLIHLGYLAYDNNTQMVRIPNKEVRTEFDSLLKNESKSKLADLVKKSEQLFQATINLQGDVVAKAIDDIRWSEYAPTFYNNEQALRYVIKFAYICCVDMYQKVEELPSGKGVADVVYIPKKDSNLPAMVVELKWNKTETAALQQIKEKKYPAILQDYAGDILLVGVNYNEKTKHHSCLVERASC